MDVFDDFLLMEHGHTYWLLADPPQREAVGKLVLQTAGVPVLRRIQERLKPTTVALQTFGFRATKNLVRLERQQITQLLHQGRLSLRLPVSRGYVILALGEHIVGCGLYTGKTLVSQIPRSFLTPPSPNHS